MRSRFPHTLICIAALAWSLAACTTVNVYSDAGVKTTRHFGFVNVVDIATGSAAVETRFAGLGFVDNNLVVGMQSSNTLYMAENSCIVAVDDNSRINPDVFQMLQLLNCHWIERPGQGVLNAD